MKKPKYPEDGTTEERKTFFELEHAYYEKKRANAWRIPFILSVTGAAISLIALIAPYLQLLWQV